MVIVNLTRFIYHFPLKVCPYTVLNTIVFSLIRKYSIDQFKLNSVHVSTCMHLWISRRKNSKLNDSFTVLIYNLVSVTYQGSTIYSYIELHYTEYMLHLLQYKYCVQIDHLSCLSCTLAVVLFTNGWTHSYSCIGNGHILNIYK